MAQLDYPHMWSIHAHKKGKIGSIFPGTLCSQWQFTSQQHAQQGLQCMQLWSWLCTQLSGVTCQFITELGQFMNHMNLSWLSEKQKQNILKTVLGFVIFKSYTITWSHHSTQVVPSFKTLYFAFILLYGSKTLIIYAGKCLWGPSHKFSYYRSEGNLEKSRFDWDFPLACAYRKHVESGICKKCWFYLKPPRVMRCSR